MEENFARGMAAIRWAVDHFEEWEIVCGLRPADLERTMDVYYMLRDAGLQEMMVSRIYAMLLESWENPT